MKRKSFPKHSEKKIIKFDLLLLNFKLHKFLFGRVCWWKKMLCKIRRKDSQRIKKYQNTKGLQTWRNFKLSRYQNISFSHWVRNYVGNRNLYVCQSTKSWFIFIHQKLVLRSFSGASLLTFRLSSLKHQKHHSNYEKLILKWERGKHEKVTSQNVN